MERQLSMRCVQCNISRVHTWISKPFPIRITLIRITFNGMASYFKHESRLPIWQPFDLDKNGSASQSFLTVRIMGNNVNPDRKRFRYSGVDWAIGSIQTERTNVKTMASLLYKNYDAARQVWMLRLTNMCSKNSASYFTPSNWRWRVQSE